MSYCLIVCISLKLAPTNGLLTPNNELLAPTTEDAVANPLSLVRPITANMRVLPREDGGRPFLTRPLNANVQLEPTKDDTETTLLTKPKNVHVRVAAPNVEVEVQSMKHGLVAKRPLDVSAEVSGS